MSAMSFEEELRQAQQNARKELEKKNMETIIDEEEYVDLKLSEYLEMIKRLKWLDSLEAAGVDNWEGISYAHEIFREDNPGLADD